MVWTELSDPNSDLTAIDKLPGRGPQPTRWVFETHQTLRMLHRREREAITDSERDAAVTSVAFEVATSGPFGRIVCVDGGEVPAAGTTVDGLRALLEGAAIDDTVRTNEEHAAGALRSRTALQAGRRPGWQGFAPTDALTPTGALEQLLSGKAIESGQVGEYR